MCDNSGIFMKFRHRRRGTIDMHPEHSSPLHPEHTPHATPHHLDFTVQHIDHAAARQEHEARPLPGATHAVELQHLHETTTQAEPRAPQIGDIVHYVLCD